MENFNDINDKLGRPETKIVDGKCSECGSTEFIVDEAIAYRGEFNTETGKLEYGGSSTDNDITNIYCADCMQPVDINIDDCEYC